MSVFDAEDAEDPIDLFRRWFAAAAESEPNDPEAVALATSSLANRPSVRMVLMKRVDADGFSFYTNAESHKGCDLAENPHAAMCFHWKTQRRQVRVEGSVHLLSAADSDAYFHSRGRRSQLGAVASAQSRPLSSRAELEARAQQVAERFPGDVPRPAYWRGYLLQPVNIEFWQDGPDRLHDRIVFTRQRDAWSKARLFP